MSDPVVFRASHVFPVSAPPLAGGYVSIAEGRIVAVSHRRPDGKAIDLGNVALVPGFVNSHTHLEFSDLDTPLGSPGMEFANWVRLVVAHRRKRMVSGETADDDVARGINRAVSDGLAECLSGGATHVGEIAVPSDDPHRYEAYRLADANVTVFHEMIGLSQEGVDPHVAGARCHVQQTCQLGDGLRPGLSPHAPYTAHPELVQRSVRLSAEMNVPVAMHLAESSAELELLAEHRGPLVGFLREMGVWSPAAVPRGIRPFDYLQWLAEAHRALIVHGNYLIREEIDLLAAHRDSMSLVYCPRTHAYFDHPYYALADRLAAGVNVCLGTDSRASNPDLSLLAEMHFVAYNQTGVAPRDILEMATLAGARALGLDAVTGSLQPGKAANLTVLELPEQAADDPHELLFDPACRVQAVYRAGRRVV